VFASRYFRRADFVLLATVALLISVGCLMIFSCTRTGLAARGSAQWEQVKSQLMWVAIGLVVLLVTMSIDYMRLPSLHLAIYGVVLLLLVIVLVMPPVRGTHRWIVFGPIRLQPAELAQVVLLITIACVASAREHVHDFPSVGKVLLWLVPALGLILVEPDLGTPVVILSTGIAILYFAGARWTHLGGYIAALVLLFSAACFSGVIKQYQIDRLLIFLHPERDPHGDGWQPLQALTAVGNGGFFGKGLFKGPQTGGHFVPDQHTDFIFTAIAEELGFLGAVAVLALFGVLLWRCTVAIAEAKDPLGRMIAAGATTVIAFHVIDNIAMTIGLAPVKGLPLPLVSYGGSSMIATMIAIGLVENVYMRRHKIAF
jgi:rod shape determining protein RodA